MQFITLSNRDCISEISEKENCSVHFIQVHQAMPSKLEDLLCEIWKIDKLRCPIVSDTCHHIQFLNFHLTPSSPPQNNNA